MYMASRLVLSAASLAAVALMMGASVPARATTLLNLINAPSQDNTAYVLPFTASSSSTTISIAGYQVPSYEQTSFNGLFLGGAGPNLLGGTWAFVPAASGSLSNTYSDGTSVPALNFGGVATGYYDTFSQTIATIAGDSYTLDFLYSNSADNAPSGLLVTTSDISSTPLPAALPMFAGGLVLVGLLARKKRRATTRSLPA
jgi:hypothetical protein